MEGGCKEETGREEEKCCSQKSCVFKSFWKGERLSGGGSTTGECTNVFARRGLNGIVQVKGSGS